jgi:2-oxo-4-hydroxy-4-carboxy-5-ureidoimidazoline decarboxylase
VVSEFHRMNDAYSEKFGFPFIVCVREQKRKDAILNAFRTRLQHTSIEQEKQTALGEIKKIALIRLSDIIIVQQ